MKTIKFFAMVLLIGMIAVACEKEGKEGPQGPAGTNGADGNANVTVYGFGERIFSSDNAYWVTFAPDGLTNGMVDSSLILTYYKPSGTGYPWYITGGLGPDGNYQTKMLIYNTLSWPSIEVRLNNPDGSYYNGIDVTWDTVRIFVIPISTLKVAEKQNINLNNYNEVNTYFDAK